MWEPDKFDPGLIAQDFARANSVGITTLRIFVQTPLRDDINAATSQSWIPLSRWLEQHNLNYCSRLQIGPNPTLPAPQTLIAGSPLTLRVTPRSSPTT